MLHISEKAKLLRAMYEEEHRLEDELKHLEKSMFTAMDKRDAIRCCRVALEREVLK